MNTISRNLIRMSIYRPVARNTQVEIIVLASGYPWIKKIPEKELSSVKYRRLHPDIITLKQRPIISTNPVFPRRRLQWPPPFIDPVVRSRYKNRILIIPEIIK